ncbi:MAG: hypothetical protein LBI28_00700 [Treponema sp.]|jgi:hypothetical protein|nr:hypothetical protein [Treponema sp.]
MDNKYVTKNMEDLFAKRLQIAEANKANKKREEEISKEKEETGKKVMEFMGETIYPVFASFANLLSSKNINCRLSSNLREEWSSEKIIMHKDGSPIEDISLNFYDGSCLSMIPRENKSYEYYRKPPKKHNLASVKVGDAIQYFIESSSGYDVFERTLQKRTMSHINIQISGGYYDGEIHYQDNYGREYNEEATYLPLSLDFSLLSLYYHGDRNNSKGLHFSNDVAFDRKKHIKSFIGSLNFTNKMIAAGHDIDPPSPHSIARHQAIYHCIVRRKGIIIYNELDEIILNRMLFDWLDTLIKNKLLQ